MSFRCQGCDKTIFNRMYRFVTKKRDKIYTYEKIKYVKGEKTTEKKTSKGWEIAEEIGVCAKCIEKLERENVERTQTQTQKKNNWKDSLNRIG